MRQSKKVTNDELSSYIEGLVDPARRKKCVLAIYEALTPLFHSLLIKRGVVLPKKREKIIQDAFVALLHAVENRVKANQPFILKYPKAYLCRIVYNCFLKECEKKNNQADLCDESIESLEESLVYNIPDEPGSVEVRLSIFKIWKIFTKNHPKCAAGLEYLVTEECSYAELAIFFEKTEGAARQFIYECRKKLKPLWKKHTV